MKTYFSTFSDYKITKEELLSRISLSQEEDIPDEIVSHFATMLMGENGFSFTKLNVMRDMSTGNFYGIVFSSIQNNDTQSKMLLSVSMIDERLKETSFLSKIFQSMINDFCNHQTDRETFIQWDSEIHSCFYSKTVTDVAELLAKLLC